jgi:hypothetical protein
MISYVALQVAQKGKRSHFMSDSNNNSHNSCKEKSETDPSCTWPNFLGVTIATSSFDQSVKTNNKHSKEENQNSPRNDIIG